MINKYDLREFVDVITVDSVTSDLVERFKKHRKEAKFTQKQLAELTGVSYGSIRRFEQTGEISLSSLLKLSDKLDYLEDFELLFKNKKVKSLRYW